MLPTPPFWSFVQPTPLLQFSVNSNPTPNVLYVVLFLWLNRWSHHIWCAILRNDNMDLHMLAMLTTKRALMCVLCNKASSLLRPDTYDFLLVLWFDITHTQAKKHTHHTQEPVHWHTNINIYLHHVLCAHSSYHLIIHWYQKFTFHNAFPFQILFNWKVIYPLIRCYRFFLLNTNKQNTHTHTHTHTPNIPRKITLERVS